MTNLKEKFLLTSTFLGFFADIVSLVSFFTGETGIMLSIVIAVVTAVLVIVVAVDFRTNRDSYPFLRDILKSLLHDRLLFSFVVLLLGLLGGMMCGAILAAVHTSISNPNVQDPITRTMIADRLVLFVLIGAGAGFFLAFIALYYASVASVSWSIVDLIPSLERRQVSQNKVMADSKKTHSKKSVLPKPNLVVRSLRSRYVTEQNKAIIAFEGDNVGRAGDIFLHLTYGVVAKGKRETRHWRKVLCDISPGVLRYELPAIILEPDEIFIEKSVRIEELRPYLQDEQNSSNLS